MSDRIDNSENEKREEKEAIERVEEFLRRVRDFEITIGERAGKIILGKYDEAGRMRLSSLADVSSLMEENYQEQKNTKYEELFDKLFSRWIDKAHYCGVIKNAMA